MVEVIGGTSLDNLDMYERWPPHLDINENHYHYGVGLKG